MKTLLVLSTVWEFVALSIMTSRIVVLGRATISIVSKVFLGYQASFVVDTFSMVLYFPNAYQS